MRFWLAWSLFLEVSSRESSPLTMSTGKLAWIAAKDVRGEYPCAGISPKVLTCTPLRPSRDVREVHLVEAPLRLLETGQLFVDQKEFVQQHRR